MAGTSRISVVVFFAFGGFCLQVGLLIGNDLGRLHCVHLSGQHGTEPAVVISSAVQEGMEGVQSPVTAEGQAGRVEQKDAVASAVSRGKLQNSSGQTSEKPIQGREPLAAGIEVVADKFEARQVSNLIAGAVHVKRNDIAAVVDVGVPIDPGDREKDDVLILYTSDSSLPSGDSPMSYG
jgi:hypothetical protein